MKKIFFFTVSLLLVLIATCLIKGKDQRYTISAIYPENKGLYSKIHVLYTDPNGKTIDAVKDATGYFLGLPIMLAVFSWIVMTALQYFSLNRSPFLSSGEYMVLSILLPFIWQFLLTFCYHLSGIIKPPFSLGETMNVMFCSYQSYIAFAAAACVIGGIFFFGKKVQEL